MRYLKIIPILKNKREFVGITRSEDDEILVFAKWVEVIFLRQKWEYRVKKKDNYYVFDVYLPHRRCIPRFLRGTTALLMLDRIDLERLQKFWDDNGITEDNVMFAITRVSAYPDQKSVDGVVHSFKLIRMDFNEPIKYIRDEDEEAHLSEGWTDEMLKAVRIYRIAVQPFYPNPSVREFKNFFLDLGLSIEDVEYIYKHREEVGI